MKIVRLYDRFEKSVSADGVARGVGQVHWDKESIVMGGMTFQELKRFFQSIKFRAGDLVKSNDPKSISFGKNLYVVDFNHEAYFCIDSEGNNFELKFQETESAL